ncbi:MAG: cohesin domain-containing protein, partial [Planctomycetota bacterium]|nr:cohesin domain-containing protein [Planctomycetota bacterium]
PAPLGTDDRGIPSGAPTTLTVMGVADPEDVGVGGEVEVSFFIDNPSNVFVLAWEFEVAYDNAAFDLIDCIDGDFPEDGLKIVDLEDDGLASVCVFSVAGTTSSTGRLVTLRFGINLPQAVAAETATFSVENLMVVVNDGGVIRLYGEPGETASITDATVVASDLDVDGDGEFDILDLYAWHQTPNDANQDGVIDDADRVRVMSNLRAGETQDVIPASN